MAIFVSIGQLAFSFILNIYESKLSKRESNFDKFSSSSSDKGCFKNIKIKIYINNILFDYHTYKFAQCGKDSWKWK